MYSQGKKSRTNAAGRGNKQLSTTVNTEPTAQVNMTEFVGSVKSSIKMSKDMKYI